MDRRNSEAQRERQRRRIFEIVEIGAADDLLSRGYDFFGSLVVVLALAASVAATFDGAEERCGVLLNTVEIVTSAFFAVDYVLRVWTARCLYPTLTPGKATVRYVSSIGGLIDLASFLPTFLPVFFPSGMVAFRMFRVVRIFRLFRINAYYDSLNVITQVLTSKAQQLLSSVFIILVLMTASSLCMYSLEHDAQPDVFSNAFSGIWWAVSTLLTVGYGDIYPITALGKIFGILITFLGVGMVAIPTGIISAGFVDQYSRIKRISEYGTEADIHFIRIHLTPGTAGPMPRCGTWACRRASSSPPCSGDGTSLFPGAMWCSSPVTILCWGQASMRMTSASS